MRLPVTTTTRQFNQTKFYQANRTLITSSQLFQENQHKSLLQGSPQQEPTQQHLIQTFSQHNRSPSTHNSPLQPRPFTTTTGKLSKLRQPLPQTSSRIPHRKHQIPPQYTLQNLQQLSKLNQTTKTLPFTKQ